MTPKQEDWRWIWVTRRESKTLPSQLRDLWNASEENAFIPVTRLGEVWERLIAIRDRSDAKGNLASLDDADAAIAILEDLAWLWDELVPTAAWLAEHEAKPRPRKRAGADQIDVPE